MKKIILTLICLLFTNAFSAQLFDFNYNGHNLQYDGDKLKFYENSKELTKEEIAQIFPDYEIILISSADKNNKIKVKNSIFGSKKILLLNDTKRTFHLFFIYPLTSRYEKQDIKSLITLFGHKNVRLKHSGGDEIELVVK